MTAAQPSRHSPGPSKKPSVDVRTLSLVQLQALAKRGSRRAKAELESRMRASAGIGTPLPSLAPAPPAATPAPAHPAAPLAQAPLRAIPAEVPTLTVRATPDAPVAAAPDKAQAPAIPQQALIQQLELLAQQEQARNRTDGPPRLIGMALMTWGILIMLGGLLMFIRGSGLYYLLGGAGTTAVGWLIFQCSRWSIPLQCMLMAVALGWAWRSSATGSLALASIQAAPMLVPALWMAVRPVREPLD